MASTGDAALQRKQPRAAEVWPDLRTGRPPGYPFEVAIPFAAPIGALLVGLAVVAVSLPWASAVLAACCVAWWFARLDGWQRLYALALSLLVAASSAYEQVVAAAFYPRYLALGLLVLWTVVAHRDDVVPLRSLARPVRRILIGLHSFSALSVASSVWSVAPGITAQNALALVMLSAMLHLLATRRWTRHSRIEGDLRVAFVILSASAAASIVASLVGLPNALTYQGRLQGVFFNPNALAMAAALAVPLAWGLYRGTGRLRYLVAAMAPLYAIALSGSRTSMLAVLIALAVMFLHSTLNVRSIVPALYGVAGAVVLYVASGLQVDGIQSLNRISDRSVGLNTRSDAWASAINFWQERPLQGFGYQAGETVFADRQGLTGFYFERTSVHNSFLQALLEVGLIGLLILTYLTTQVVMAVFRSPGSGFNYGLLGVTITGLAIQITESAVFGTGQVFPWVFWLAVVALVLGRPDRQSSVEQRSLAAAA